MRIIDSDEIKSQKNYILEEIERGAVFVYPTDTIYGIGCDAQNPDSVKKIRELKGRATNPFSVIVPSLEWVHENCIVTNEGEKWLKKLPGPYTLIFKLKNSGCITKEVNPNLKSLGIRLPKHWIKEIVAKAQVPIVTTSVNRAGEDYMTSLDDIDHQIRAGIDFILEEGKKEGRPSKIVDLTGAAKVIER